MAHESSFTVVENVFIHLTDGVKLAAKVWLPAEASEVNKVPAVLEFLPYRKRDVTSARDAINYSYFASKGYAGVRVDMRGCGDSTGDTQDEYIAQEQRDAIEVINWISKQSWCTGNVGMMGISWGGFNSLQVAFEQPAPLKAIIAIDFTDDRYSDDIHFKGGVMLMDNVKWAADMEHRYSLPPDPLISPDWRQMWLSRLSNSVSLFDIWLSHPTRDELWKHGSVCEDFSRIKTPAFLIGGYGDGYTNTVRRTFSNLSCPKRALIGPWVHLYPHIAVPGPQWGFLPDAVAWWDVWLKGKQGQCWPSEVYFINENVSIPSPEHVDGTWIKNPTTENQTLFLLNGKLGRIASAETVAINTKEHCGSCTNHYFPCSLDELPQEQTPDDSLSCVFETDEVTEEYIIFGQPSLIASVASNQSVANIFARLCIVDTNGNSRLIAYSAFNLNHDEEHQCVTPLKPGEFKDVRLTLDMVGEKLRPGSKLRLCISSSFWPMFLPNPDHVSLNMDLSKCMFTLPRLVSFDLLKNEEIPPLSYLPDKDYEILRPSSAQSARFTTEDGKAIVNYTKSDEKRCYLGHGLITDTVTEITDSVEIYNPLSVTSRIKKTSVWSRLNWKADIYCDVKFRVDKEFMYIHQTKVAKHNDQIIFEKTYDRKYPRIGI